ncbi:hypothetical protein BGZ83_004974 [Gryganskiella cystojenkinii]|nr:hypothetical protein BGZ83_004974 [Gryganskiella cystojenkinii]
MSLSELPPECLEHILRFLMDRGDKTTLSRMLQINRFHNKAILPFLYSEPFSRSRDRLFCPTSLFKLVQMLLQKRPAEAVSDLLSTAYDVFPDRTAVPAVAAVVDLDPFSEPEAEGYLSLIREFNFERVIFKTFDVVDLSGDRIEVNWSHYPQRLANYVFKTETGAIASANDPGPHDQELWFPIQGVLAWPYSLDALRYGALSTALRRDLTWTLCSPVFEQIKDFNIPLSDIGRYLDAVERFSSLIDVTFIIDEPVNEADLNELANESSPEEISLIQQCLEHRSRSFEGMFQFVQRHRSIFPNLLQAACCHGDETWPGAVFCPAGVNDRLVSLLPAILSPKTINYMTWPRVVQNLASIDVQSLETLDLGIVRRAPDGRDALTILLEHDSQFLSRCRALKTLSVDSVPSFRWALDEKVARDAFEESTTVVAAGSIGVGERPLPPVCLRKLSLRSSSSLGNKLNDAVFAFGGTLRALDVTVQPPGILSEGSLGQGWRLPALTSLCLTQYTQAPLLIESNLLASGLGENLSEMSLRDKSGPYDCQEIITCGPVLKEMPKMKSITLWGWPALTFHPATLHHTPNLKSLSVRMAQGWIPPEDELLASFQSAEMVLADNIPEEQDGEHESMKIPSIGTGGHRVPWTWDWYLPYLEQLYLNAEFALLFRFRMLEGCPSLRSLSLDLTPERLEQEQGQDQEQGLGPERVLSLQDFLVSTKASTTIMPFNGSININNSNNSKELGSKVTLISSSLESLRLYGRWILNDDQRHVVFRDVFPKLNYVEERGTSGYSLAGWLSAMRGRPTLTDIIYVFENDEGREAVNPDVLKAHGLVLIPEHLMDDLQRFYFIQRGDEENDEPWAFEEDLERVLENRNE